MLARNNFPMIKSNEKKNFFYNCIFISTLIKVILNLFEQFLSYYYTNTNNKQFIKLDDRRWLYVFSDKVLISKSATEETI